MSRKKHFFGVKKNCDLLDLTFDGGYGTAHMAHTLAVWDNIYFRAINVGNRHAKIRI